MTRFGRRSLLAVVVFVAVCGALAGGSAWAAFQDSSPAEANASAGTFTVTATVESISPSELNRSQSGEGPVVVELSLPAPGDVDNSTLTASFQNVNGTTTPSNVTCDGEWCTVEFNESALEGLAPDNATYTLTVTGNYDDGGSFASTDENRSLEVCDTGCDGTAGSMTPIPITGASDPATSVLSWEVMSRGE